MGSRTRRVFATLAALLAVLVLPIAGAACGEETKEETPSPSPSPSATAPNVINTAESAGTFTILLTAIKAAGLQETLQGEGPFTVFAPDDTAFGKVSLAQVNQLLSDPEGALTAVLLYHVVPGKYMAADLTDGMKLQTANGMTLTIRVGGDGVVRVNGVRVKKADIETTNGVIHVINRVLIPKDLPSPSPSAVQ